MGNVWISKVHFIKQLWLCSVLMAQVVYLFSPRLNSFVMHGNAKEGSWLASPNLPSSYLLRDSDYIGILYMCWATWLLLCPGFLKGKIWKSDTRFSVCLFILLNRVIITFRETFACWIPHYWQQALFWGKQPKPMVHYNHVCNIGDKTLGGVRLREKKYHFQLGHYNKNSFVGKPKDLAVHVWYVNHIGFL